MKFFSPIPHLALCALGAAALALPASLAAQGGFAGLAPPSAMDTLSGMGTGAGGGNPFGGNPFGGAAQGGFPGAMPGGGFPGAMPGGGFPGAMPGGGFPGAMPGGFGDPLTGGFGGGFGGTPDFQVQVPMIRALYGTRVTCAVTGALLADAVEVQVAEAFKDQYFDDGKSGGDARADDGLYTNATARSDAMSPEAHLAKTRLIGALRTVESFEPNDFFVVPVASTEPIEGIPQMIDLEEQRDARLQDWMTRFLSDYRVTPDAVGEDAWAFHEVYLPPPPRTPTVAMPSGFLPPSVAERLAREAEQNQNQGGGAGGFPGGGFPGGFPGGGGL